MPSLEEHCEHSSLRYGVEGRDIHVWLDRPIMILERKHRSFKYNLETVKEVGRIFGNEYGIQLAQNIALDHLILDNIYREEETEEWKKKEELETKQQREMFRRLFEKELQRLTKKNFTIEILAEGLIKGVKEKRVKREDIEELILILCRFSFQWSAELMRKQRIEDIKEFLFEIKKELGDEFARKYRLHPEQHGFVEE